MKKHKWHEVIDESEVMYYEANYHAGHWTLRTILKSSEDWVYHQEISKENLEKLRQVLWSKYQRGRGSYAIINKLDKQIAKLN